VIDPFEIGFPPTRLDLDKDVLATGKPLTSCPGSYPGNEIVIIDHLVRESQAERSPMQAADIERGRHPARFDPAPHLTCRASTD
jgi:hypothetical protein